MHKLYDLAVKTGEYQNNQGETKGRYENIGSVMQGDNGQFIILKRTFNPAGVPNPDCKDSVIVSCFEPQQQNHPTGHQQQAPQQQSPQQGYTGHQAPQQGYGQPQQGGHNQGRG